MASNTETQTVVEPVTEYCRTGTCGHAKESHNLNFRGDPKEAHELYEQGDSVWWRPRSGVKVPDVGSARLHL